MGLLEIFHVFSMVLQHVSFPKAYFLTTTVRKLISRVCLAGGAATAFLRNVRIARMLRLYVCDISVCLTQQ